MDAIAVRVCPDRDIECGARAAAWCKHCPKRGLSDAAASVIEGAMNTSRISWMAAQQDMKIETTVLMGTSIQVVEIVIDGDVVGRGDTLQQALDDAMGVAHG